MSRHTAELVRIVLLAMNGGGRQLLKLRARIRRRWIRIRDWRKLGWRATHTHDLSGWLRFPLWPPFFSTGLFLPKVKGVLVNNGQHIERATISASIILYDGPLVSIAKAKGDDVVTFSVEGDFQNWKTGQRRKLRIRVPRGTLPRAGTYALKIDVNPMVKGTEPIRVVLERQLADVDPATVARVRELFADAYDEIPELVQSGTFKATLAQYLHVEPFSSVVNFGVVCGTFITAIATVVLALTT